MDLVDLSARLTRRLPERVGAFVGWHVSQHASRKTRIAHLRTGGRVAADVGDHLHRDMFFRGVYEPAVTRLLMSIATPGWNVIDVGANVGYFSVVASDLGGPGSRVLAFEPHPVLGEMLATTARSNPNADITVEHAACGSAPGMATLHVSPEDRNSGLGTLRDDLHESTGIEVPVVRVDDACRRHRLEPDLIKIDVEGFEPEVVEGCGYLLEQRVPARLIIELSAGRGDPAPVIDRLRDCGYRARGIRDDGSLTAIGPIDPVYEDVCFERID
jgi:FkbM family methyltransferase